MKLIKSVFNRITNNQFTPGVLIFLAILIVVFFMIQFPHKETEFKDLPFSVETVKDPTTELGTGYTTQVGSKGTESITYEYTGTLFDLIFQKGNIKKEKLSSSITKKPTNTISVMGTKKYQYMYCSNGTYQYFTDEQFKDPNTGFTHKSKDLCAENNDGTMTYLADAAPVANPTVKVSINPNLTSNNPTYNTSNPPVVNQAVYTSPVTTGNPEARQLCTNNYNSAKARLGSPPSGWNYGDSSPYDYLNSLNDIESTYEQCLRVAGY